MSLLEWAVFFLLAFVVVLGLRGLPRVWRHETPLWDEPPAWWVWGEPLFRGWVRVMPVSVPFVAVLDALLLLGELSGSSEADAIVGYEIPLYALAFLLLALLMLMTTIIFYNRPKFLVPPHLRSEPGIVQTYKMRKQRSA